MPKRGCQSQMQNLLPAGGGVHALFLKVRQASRLPSERVSASNGEIFFASASPMRAGETPALRCSATGCLTNETAQGSAKNSMWMRPCLRMSIGVAPIEFGAEFFQRF